MHIMLRCAAWKMILSTGITATTVVALMGFQKKEKQSSIHTHTHAHTLYGKFVLMAQ